MVVRESQNRYTPRPPGARNYTPASRTRKGHVHVPLVHPSVADTLVEGIRVVFDDWTDDMDQSIDRPVHEPPRSPVVQVRGPAVTPPVAPKAAKPVARRKSSWARVITLLVAIVVVSSLFFAVGGFGALVVALAAAAGAVFLVMPSGIDVVVVPAAPSSGVEIAAPAEGKSDAELVVMPDPGFRGTIPLPKPQHP